MSHGPGLRLHYEIWLLILLSFGVHPVKIILPSRGWLTPQILSAPVWHYTWMINCLMLLNPGLIWSLIRLKPGKKPILDLGQASRNSNPSWSDTGPRKGQAQAIKRRLLGRRRAILYDIPGCPGRCDPSECCSHAGDQGPTQQSPPVTFLIFQGMIHILVKWNGNGASSGYRAHSGNRAHSENWLCRLTEHRDECRPIDGLNSVLRNIHSWAVSRRRRIWLNWQKLKPQDVHTSIYLLIRVTGGRFTLSTSVKQYH